MVQQPIILKIVFFVPNLCLNPQEDNTHHPSQHLLEDSIHHPRWVMYPSLDNPVTVDRPWHSQAAKGHNGLAMPSAVQSAVVLPAISYTCVNCVVPTTVPGSAPTGTVPFTKPTHWTPLRPFILERELSNHPDQAFVKQLINDLRHGCFIGYEGPQFSHCANNLVSAYQHPTTIDATLKKECQLGRILGPFQYPPLPNFRTSGLGLVPKHDGGWRIIYHLFAPPYKSINDFIDPDDYSVSYCTIDDAYDFINQLGPGTLLSKIDLKDAFRLISVHPSQWNLLGICWKTRFYVDTCLPFGLRSAPYLFNHLSEAIHWILVHKYGVRHLLHYLDDFLTAGPPDSTICSNNINSMLSLCECINAPIKSSKIEGPSTSITFLGIQLHTITMEASITPQRKDALLAELN